MNESRLMSNGDPGERVDRRDVGQVRLDEVVVRRYRQPRASNAMQFLPLRDRMVDLERNNMLQQVGPAECERVHTGTDDDVLLDPPLDSPLKGLLGIARSHHDAHQGWLDGIKRDLVYNVFQGRESQNKPEEPSAEKMCVRVAKDRCRITHVQGPGGGGEICGGYASCRKRHREIR